MGQDLSAPFLGVGHVRAMTVRRFHHIVIGPMPLFHIGKGIEPAEIGGNILLVGGTPQQHMLFF